LKHFTGFLPALNYIEQSERSLKEKGAHFETLLQLRHSNLSE